MRHHNVGVWNQESCFTFRIYAFLWQNIQWSSLFLSTLKVADCAHLGSPPVCVGIRSKKSAKVFFVWESKKLKFDGKTRISCSKLHRVGGGSIWGRHFAGMGDFPAWPSTRQRSPSIGTTNWCSFWRVVGVGGRDWFMVSWSTCGIFLYVYVLSYICLASSFVMLYSLSFQVFWNLRKITLGPTAVDETNGKLSSSPQWHFDMYLYIYIYIYWYESMTNRSSSWYGVYLKIWVFPNLSALQNMIWPSEKVVFKRQPSLLPTERMSNFRLYMFIWHLGVVAYRPT